MKNVSNAKKSNSLRVVVDTNVIVSALVFGGKPLQLIETLLELGTIVISPELISEARRIIHSKFPSFIEELKRFEGLAKRDGLTVLLGGFHVVVSRDPDDDMVIETALAGKCQYIISGDKDLLLIKNYRGIKILKPSEFLKHFAN